MRAIGQNDNFSITKMRKNAPKINGAFFASIKNKILGKNYRLSLVLATASLSKKLNLRYRRKNRPANVLSFDLDKKEGEVFIYSKSKTETISLFIHALCHLKGLSHGSKMDSEEKKYKKWLDKSQPE